MPAELFGTFSTFYLKPFIYKTCHKYPVTRPSGGHNQLYAHLFDRRRQRDAEQRYGQRRTGRDNFSQTLGRRYSVVYSICVAIVREIYRAEEIKIHGNKYVKIQQLVNGSNVQFRQLIKIPSFQGKNQKQTCKLFYSQSSQNVRVDEIYRSKCNFTKQHYITIRLPYEMRANRKMQMRFVPFDTLYVQFNRVLFVTIGRNRSFTLTIRRKAQSSVR